MAVDAPVTPTARQAKFREKRKAEGYKFVQVWLPADAATDLAAIQNKFPEMSLSEILAVSIKKARMSTTA